MKSIQEAKEAIYDERALKEVPEACVSGILNLSSKSKMGRNLLVGDQIKRRVEFFEHNLQQEISCQGHGYHFFTQCADLF